MNKGFTMLLAVLGILVVALVAGVFIFRFPRYLPFSNEVSPTPETKSIYPSLSEENRKEIETIQKEQKQLDKLTKECVDLLTKSPIKQVENGDATGTISGSLSYSAGGWPSGMMLCAIDINYKVRYCTKSYVENKNYKYGRGYEISLPTGSYYVAYLDSNNENTTPITVYGEITVGGTDIYSHQEVLRPTVVKVGQGSDIRDITPEQNFSYIICDNN